MLEVKVTIEAKDLSEAITNLAQAITNLAQVISGIEPVSGDATPVEQPEAAITPEAEPEPVPEPMPVPEPVAEPESEPIPTPVKAPKPLDLDTISRAGAALIDQGKMQDVLKLLQQKYNILAVTQLDPSQFEAFAADLRALGAEI